MSTTITPSYSLGLNVRNFLVRSFKSPNVKKTLPIVLDFVRGLYSEDTKTSVAVATHLANINELHEAVSTDTVARKIQVEAHCMSNQRLSDDSSLLDSSDIETILKKLSKEGLSISCEFSAGQSKAKILYGDQALFPVTRNSRTEYNADGIEFPINGTLYRLINSKIKKPAQKLHNLSYVASGK